MILTADNMFEKLGYNKIDLKKDKWGKVWGVTYVNEKHYIEITFDLVGMEVVANTMDGEAVYLTVDDIRAIEEKMTELNWFEKDKGILYD